MDKPMRVELHLGARERLSQEPQPSVIPHQPLQPRAISCEVSEVEIGQGRRRWFAHGAPSPGSPEFTAWSEYEHAAMLAVFAKWLGVVQPLREVLANVEREAWNKDGRWRFRRALGVLLDEIDSRHKHDISEGSENSECHNDAIDVLWRIGCAAFLVAYNGCAINPEGSPYFFVETWIREAKLAVHDVRDSFQLHSAAAQSTARQLLHFAQSTRRR
jgi:hypothetical protein